MDESIGREFIRKTRHHEVPVSDQKLGLPQPPLEMAYDATATLIDLPDQEEVIFPAVDVRDAIERRTTVRTYADKPLTLHELTFLLWLTQGVKQVSARPATLRTVPSAGARHAFETFLLVNKVKGLKPGLYRYIALEHALIELEVSLDLNSKITDACEGQKQVANSAVTFFWAAVVERMTWRYPERGYRYLFLDAGHVCQNLYLAADVIQCGVCPIGAFDDLKLNQALNLDGDDQFVAYAASVGKKAE